MQDLKSRRKLRAQLNNPTPKQVDPPEQITKNMLKKLSLSFYSPDTIHKNKQIICQNYEIYDDLPQIIQPRTQRSTKRQNDRGRSLKISKQKQKKNSLKLKIDNFFQDEKQDEYDIVTTNASLLDRKDRERAAQLNKSSRPNSVKVKYHKPGGKAVNASKSGGDVSIADRCMTPKCFNRKGSRCSLKKQ